MICLPGTPCYDENNPPALPEGVCSSDFIGYPIISSFIYYSGTYLPNTGIVTNDFLTVALQKIDPQLSAVSIAEKILDRMVNNPTYNAQICNVVNECIGITTTTTSSTSTSTTSTSTSTSTSTTSTTTTAAPLNVLTYFGPTPGNACEENYYTVNVTLNVEATNVCTATIIYADYASYSLFNVVIYVKQSGTTVYRKFQIDPTGSFATPLELCEACSSITTTTTSTTSTSTTTTTTTLPPSELVFLGEGCDAVSYMGVYLNDGATLTNGTVVYVNEELTILLSDGDYASQANGLTGQQKHWIITGGNGTLTSEAYCPIDFNISTDCNITTSQVTIGGFSGGQGTNYEIALDTTSQLFLTEAAALAAPIWFNETFGGNLTISEVNYPGPAGGTYWTAVRDTANPTNVTAKSILTADCTTPTTTTTSSSTSTTTSTTSTSTSTTSTTSSTSTTTTLPPITLSVTPGCTGGENTGTVLANGFSGGTESFEYISISSTSAIDALSRLDNPATRTLISGATEYTFTGLGNATYYVAIMDYSGNKGVSSGAIVNCITTTTSTTSTSSTTTSTSTSTTTTTTTLPCQCFTVLNEGSVTANYTVTNCDGSVQSPNLTVGSSFQHCVKGGTVIVENSGILGVYDCGTTCTTAGTCTYCGPGPSNVTISPQNSLATSSYTVYVNGVADTGWKTGTRSYPAYTRIKIIYAAPACGVKLGAANYDSDTTTIILGATSYTYTLYNANNYVNNGSPYCSGNELRQPTINDCGTTSYTLISSCSCSCNQACSGTYLGAEYCSGNQRLQDEFYVCNNVFKQTNTISTCSCTCNVACGGTYFGSNYCDGNALKRKQYYVCNNAETGVIETLDACSCTCNAACDGEYGGTTYCNPNGAGQVLQDIYYNCNNAYVRTDVVNACSCSCNVGCNGTSEVQYCIDTTLWGRLIYNCDGTTWAGPPYVIQVNSPTCGYVPDSYDVYQEQCGASFAYYYVNFNVANTFTSTINGECCNKVASGVDAAFVAANYPTATFFATLSNDNCSCF